jgi:nucleoside permease NupC
MSVLSTLRFKYFKRLKRAKIPQFDFSTLSIVLFSSLLSAVLYYAFISLRLLPEIITVLKFRTKKLFKENSLNLNLVFLPNLFSYDVIVKRKK